MSKSEKPEGLSQELWEKAGAMGIDVWEEEDGRVRMHAGGGFFPTLDPENVEGQVQQAIGIAWNEYTKYSSERG